MVRKEYFRRGKQRRDGHFQRYWYAFSKRFRNPVVSEDRIRAVKPSDLGRGFEVIPPDLVEGFANDFVQDELQFLIESRPGISEGDILAERDRFIKDGIEKIPKPQLRDLIESHRVVQRQRALTAEIEERAERKRKPWLEKRAEAEMKRVEAARKGRRATKELLEEAGIELERKGLLKEAELRKREREVEKLEAEARGRIAALKELKDFGLLEEPQKEKPERPVVRLPALLEKMKELEKKG